MDSSGPSCRRRSTSTSRAHASSAWKPPATRRTSSAPTSSTARWALSSRHTGRADQRAGRPMALEAAGGVTLEEESMKAIVFAQTGGPEVLALADVPRPDVRPGAVLIKNHAIGVNFADTRFLQGTYTIKPKLPDSPGMEVAGVIEAVGDGVTNLRPGMRAAAFTSRAYAEYCVSPAFMVIPLPESVGFVDGAAFLIQVLTAYHLLH